MSIVTFAVSHTVFEKFDVKQSNDLEICPRSLTVEYLRARVAICDFQLFEKNAFEVFEVSKCRLRFIS